jgi:hypothetical protein
MKILSAIKIVIFLLNILALIYLIYDSFVIVEFHKSEGTFSYWEYVARAFVISIPACTLTAIFLVKSKVLLYCAILFNCLIFLIGLSGYYVVLFSGAYELMGIFAVLPFSLYAVMNILALRYTARVASNTYTELTPNQKFETDAKNAHHN